MSTFVGVILFVLFIGLTILISASLEVRRARRKSKHLSTPQIVRARGAPAATSTKPISAAEKDYAEAAKWYRSLADRGDAAAQYRLGNMHQYGRGRLPDAAEAAKWYRLAADQGYIAAQRVLGSMFTSGLGVPKDYAEAAKWYRLAADRGDAAAQADLARMYRNGQGVPKDTKVANLLDAGRSTCSHWLWAAQDAEQKQNYSEAAKCYRHAADAGLPDAQYRLAVLCELGKGVPKNYAEAVKWFSLAADQNYVGAQQALGLMYKHGRGVQQNNFLSTMWFNLAAANSMSARGGGTLLGSGGDDKQDYLRQ